MFSLIQSDIRYCSLKERYESPPPTSIFFLVSAKLNLFKMFYETQVNPSIKEKIFYAANLLFGRFVQKFKIGIILYTEFLTLVIIQG